MINPIIDKRILAMIKIQKISIINTSNEVYQECNSIENRSINFFYYFEPVGLIVTNQGNYKQN